MFGLVHKDVSLMKMSKRVSPSQPTPIYRASTSQLAVTPFIGLFVVTSDDNAGASDAATLPDPTCVALSSVDSLNSTVAANGSLRASASDALLTAQSKDEQCHRCVRCTPHQRTMHHCCFCCI
jgi:hypothetical protein